MSKLTALTALIVLTLTCANLPDYRVDNSYERQYLEDKLEQAEMDKLFRIKEQDRAEIEIMLIEEQIDNINKNEEK